MPQVLVVEDDTLIGMLLADMLADMQLQVCGIETTQSGAIDAARRLRPDLMIVDAKLGRGSGLAAMAEIQLQGHVPHIFMSGTRLPCDPKGAPTLMKPFSAEALGEAIRKVLAVGVL